MITLDATEDKIVVTGAPGWAHGVFNGIPAASFRRNETWWYPRSPFSAGRLVRRLSENDMDTGIGTTATERFTHLSKQMETFLYRASSEAKMRPVEYLTSTSPWNHQREASNWLSGRPYAYLAMRMGTGKTLTAINEILIREPRRTLILCPKSVIDVWLDEFSVHAWQSDHLLTPLNKGSSKYKAEMAAAKWCDALKMRRPHVVIVNYETAWREQVAKWILDDYRPEVIIADEGHKLKAPGSRVSKFAAKLFRYSDFRLLLSGTPLPNNQMDSFGQYRFMDPGIFGTNFSRFRARYAEVQSFKGFPEIVGWRNQEEFRHILKLTMFRVDEDVLDLPSITHIQRRCNLPSKAQRVYDRLMTSFVADVESGEVTAGNALVRLLKFQQITSGFITDDEGGLTDLHNEKQQMLEDIVDGVAGEPVVVFCRFRRDLESVKEVAEKHGRCYREVSGDRNDLERGKIPRGTGVLGVQIAAGGVGVNLNASRICVFYSLGFSLAEYEQAVARLHRGGQKSAVTVYHLIARNTVDQRVYQALADKKRVVDEIMNYVKGIQ